VDERYETETGAPPFRALNIGTTETTYFPQGSKVRETNRRFNPYGSLVEIAQDGDKAVDGEERRILRRFNPNPERFVVDKVARETVLGDGPEPLAETFYVYNDGADWEAPPTRGKLTRIRRWLDQPDGSVVRSFEYDNYGNRKAVVDEVGNRTEHDYDDQDHLFVTETRNPLFFPRGTEPGDPRQRTKARWDHVFGLVEATTDIDGLETAYAYDPLCRPQRVTQPGGDYKRWEYQNLGDPDAQATAVYGPPPSAGAGEIWTRTLFDGLGRTRSVQASGRGTIIVTHQGWTTRGLLAFRTEPLYQGDPWQTTAVRYDALDRPIETRRPDGARVGTAYGRSGSFFEAVTVTDELGRDTVSHRDAFGRTARVDRFWDGEPGGMIVSTHLAYDPFDRVTGVTGDRGNAWRYRYDSLGRRTESRDPALGTWTFSYDATGRRTGQVDGRGSRTRFTYDGLGRLLSRTTDAGTPPRRGRAHPGRSFPDGDQVGSNADPWRYDGAGRLRSIPSHVVDILYDASGRATQIIYANGITTIFERSPERGWLDRVRHEKGADNALLTLGYERDRAGKVKRVHAVGRAEESFTYTYDSLDQLTRAENDTGTVVSAFAYDGLGRVTPQQPGGGVRLPAAGRASPLRPQADQRGGAGLQRQRQPDPGGVSYLWL
jgi:YD repeat-containing protein